MNPLEFRLKLQKLSIFIQFSVNLYFMLFS